MATRQTRKPGDPFRIKNDLSQKVYNLQWIDGANYVCGVTVGGSLEIRHRDEIVFLIYDREHDALLPEVVDKEPEMSESKKKDLCIVCNKLAVLETGLCSATCAKKAVGAIKAIRLLQPIADRACRFLAGLNLQDHSTKEQREQVEITNQLVSTLRPKRGKL